MSTLPTKLVLNCRAEYVQGKLRVKYAVANQGSDDYYVLDTIPTYDPETHEPRIDPAMAYLCATGEGALLLRGIPPMPEADVKTRIMPLAAKLPANQTLERQFDLEPPLRERNPYYGPVKDEDCEQLKVRTLLLVVQAIRSTVREFVAEPAPLGPNLFRVRSKNTVGDVETLRCSMNIVSTPLLKRRDRFVRIK
ncbi:MAG TPA: hypothetical protein VG713_19705 [Pirellulales bacterium]|nr:hypothetical protein [Pirellulales bacterium]